MDYTVVKRTDPKVITLPERMREVIAGYVKDGISPQEINNGYCADFACVVCNGWTGVEGIGGAKLMSDEDMGASEYTHSFIEYRGKYYDAECLNGVDNWKSLPIFARQRLEQSDQ